MIKTIDTAKLLEATTIVLTEEDVKRIEEIVETIQDYAMKTGRITAEGGTEESLLQQINWLRSLYSAEIIWNM